MSDASALWNINRQLSFCVGVAALGSALNALLALDAGGPSLAPHRWCFGLAVVLTLLPLGLIARLPRTMRRSRNPFHPIPENLRAL